MAVVIFNELTHPVHQRNCLEVIDPLISGSCYTSAICFEYAFGIVRFGAFSLFTADGEIGLKFVFGVGAQPGVLLVGGQSLPVDGIEIVGAEKIELFLLAPEFGQAVVRQVTSPFFGWHILGTQDENKNAKGGHGNSDNNLSR